MIRGCLAADLLQIWTTLNGRESIFKFCISRYSCQLKGSHVSLKVVALPLCCWNNYILWYMDTLQAHLYKLKTDPSLSHNSEHLSWEAIVKAGSAQHKHKDCTYQNLSASSKSWEQWEPLFPGKKKKRHLSSKLQSRLATVWCRGCFIMSSHITAIQNT